MKYPEPYKPKGRQNYFFSVQVNGKRRNLSTGKTLKREAYLFIKEFMESQIISDYTESTFREYSAVYYNWETSHISETL